MNEKPLIRVVSLRDSGFIRLTAWGLVAQISRREELCPQWRAAVDDEEIPPGGWRAAVDDEEIPPRGWRAAVDDEEIPPGGWRAAVDDEEIPPGGWRAVGHRAAGGGNAGPATRNAAAKKDGRGAMGLRPSHSFRDRRAKAQNEAEALPPGRFHADYTDTYRTKDGRAYFQFRFVLTEAGYYDIDILSMPSFGTRPEDLHLTHRLPSDRGGYRICLASPSDANSATRAKKFAKSWSELIWRYINSGLTF